MILDGITLRKIVAELSTVLIDGKINKIYAPNKNEILLSIYAKGTQYALFASIASDCYHFHLTTKSKQYPQNASNFCMLLRKHLIGFRITKIEMKDLERIVFIHLSGFNELNDSIQKTLVIELMGKHSNILLLNENNHIIDSLRHFDTNSGASRDILPAQPYIMPKTNKLEITNIQNKEEFIEKLSQIEENSLTELIPSCINGISRKYVENFLEKTNTQNKKTTETLSAFYEYFQNDWISIQNIESSSSPISDFNFEADDYYFEKEEKQIYRSFQSNLIRIISDDLKKIKKKLNNIESKLKECESMEKYKLYGELLTANLYQYKEERLNQISLPNYYDNNQEIVIPLEEKYTLADNAKRYFKKYTKLKNALEIVNKQKRETLQELDYLGSVLYEIENSTTLEDLNFVYEEISANLIRQSEKQANSKYTVKNNKTSEFLHFNIDGYKVYVGKNNLQNDELTLKIANKTDYWFHTKEIHGSHVILKIESNQSEPNIDTFVKCAKLAAKYSKAQYSSNIPVDYTQVKYVKKPSGAKPGMVIYTNYKTIHVTND